MLRAKTILPFVTAALTFATLTTSHEARAQKEIVTTMGNKGVLAIDQLSGFRISSIGASTGGGVSYAGPIGFSVQSVGVDDDGGRRQTTHFTSIWLAPSLDYFIIDHLSLGGIFEIISTSSSVEAPFQGGTRTVDGPTVTNITFIPRVGYLFPISDRFGIWPRGGIGFGSSSSTTSATGDKNTVSGFLIDLDVGFIFRVNENFFFRAAPEMAFGLGPSHSHTVGGTSSTISNGASLFQISGVAGIGVMWDL